MMSGVFLQAPLEHCQTCLSRFPEIECGGEIRRSYNAVLFLLEIDS